jgi:hypothetical protein
VAFAQCCGHHRRQNQSRSYTSLMAVSHEASAYVRMEDQGGLGEEGAGLRVEPIAPRKSGIPSRWRDLKFKSILAGGIPEIFA